MIVMGVADEDQVQLSDGVEVLVLRRGRGIVGEVGVDHDHLAGWRRDAKCRLSQPKQFDLCGLCDRRGTCFQKGGGQECGKQIECKAYHHNLLYPLTRDGTGARRDRDAESLSLVGHTVRAFAMTCDCSGRKEDHPFASPQDDWKPESAGTANAVRMIMLVLKHTSAA